MTGPRLTITPDGGTLEHYGVLGMKWGRSRARGDVHDIKAARLRVRGERATVENAKRKAVRVKDPAARANALAEANKVKVSALKNPDRVLAARLTRGEKIAVALLLTPVGASTLIGITSGTSRRIERKQETGKYDR